MLEIILAVFVLGLDQLTKWLAATRLITAYPIIPGVFELDYVQNRGAAWGLLQGGRVFFIVITVIICAALIYLMIKERKCMQLLSRIALTLIAAGAIGNLIDRAILGYVRDMLSFVLINFPVFNVADSSLVIGAILLIIDVFFTKNSAFDVIEKSIKERKEKKSGKPE